MVGMSAMVRKARVEYDAGDGVKSVKITTT